MLGSKTLLQYVVEEEVKEFTQTHSVTYQSPGDPLDIKGTGSFLIEINSSSTAFQKLIDSNSLDITSSLIRVSPDEYRNQLGRQIIKLDQEFSIASAIGLVHSTYQLVKERFAGTVFVLASGALINPLHPLVALELLNGMTNNLVTKVLVYSYKELNPIDVLYNSSSIESKKHDEDIKTLMQVYQSQIRDRSVSIEKNFYNVDRSRLEQSYRISKYPNEDFNKEYFLVAHQLLTKGTYVPYYGTSLVQMSNNNTSGYHLSPFKSCNISDHTERGPSSVCTGSTSNKTIEGLRTLHHANLGSPYERSCMTSASKPYADSCIKHSFDIFRAAKLI